jgi:hypothetical protein
MWYKDGVRRVASVILKMGGWAVLGLVASTACALAVHWYLPVPEMTGRRSEPALEVVQRMRVADPMGRLRADPTGAADEWRLTARRYVHIRGKTFDPYDDPTWAQIPTDALPVLYQVAVFRPGFPFACLEGSVRSMHEVPRWPGCGNAGKGEEPVLRSWSDTVTATSWTPPRPSWMVHPDRGYAAVTPTRPVLAGMLGNTVVWGGSLGSLFFIGCFLRRAARRLRSDVRPDGTSPIESARPRKATA